MYEPLIVSDSIMVVVGLLCFCANLAVIITVKKRNSEAFQFVRNQTLLYMFGDLCLIISCSFDLLQNYAAYQSTSRIHIGSYQLTFAQISVVFHVLGMTSFSVAFWTFAFVNWQTCREVPHFLFEQGFIETRPK